MKKEKKNIKISWPKKKNWWRLLVISYALLLGLYLILVQLQEISQRELPSPQFSSEHQTFYLSPQGNDDNPGTIDRPWKSLGRPANDSYSTYLQGGDTLYLRGGIYRFDYFNLEAIITNGPSFSGTPERPTIITSYPGEKASIYLSEKVTNWQRYADRPNTQIYYAPWKDIVAATHPGFVEDSAVRPQGVFVDGTIPIHLQQVNYTKTSFPWMYWWAVSLRNNQSDMIAGDFYYENDTGKLFIWLPDGKDPNTQSIEVPLARAFSFIDYSNWTIVSNLAFRFGSEPWSGFAMSGYNNVIDNIDSSYNAYAGLDGRCYNCTVKNSHFDYNGIVGSYLRGEKTVLENNTFIGNNWREFTGSGTCGGIKLIDGIYHGADFSQYLPARPEYTPHRGVSNMTIRGNLFKETVKCTSLWLDWVEDGNLIENNQFFDGGVGIELAEGTINNPNIIRNNLFMNIDYKGRKYWEWTCGLGIASSHYTYAYNNVFYNMPCGVVHHAITNGVFFEDLFRNRLTDNKVFNNIFINVTNPILLPINNGSYITNNYVDYNIFYGAGPVLCSLDFGAGCAKVNGNNEVDKNPFFSWGFGNGTTSLTEWQNLGQDRHSVIADPKLNSTAAYNFRPLLSSPAIDKGINLQDVPRDILGVTRPQGNRTDIGAYELPVAAICTENDWNALLSPTTCSLDGQQTRNWTKIGTCAKGVTHNASEEIACNYTMPECTSFTFSNWSECSISNVQNREILSSSPSDCQAGNPEVARACDHLTPCTLQNWEEQLAPSICTTEGKQSRSWKKVGSCNETADHAIAQPQNEIVNCTYVSISLEGNKIIEKTTWNTTIAAVLRAAISLGILLVSSLIIYLMFTGHKEDKEERFNQGD